jgi:GAF domain-containing protein
VRFLEQDLTNRRQTVSAALAAAQAQSPTATPVRFPGDDGGHSLAHMAQRDLDAALQLLADRAQYITGASGAAIALRRDGRNDMLCRASTGTNAPELGALLSTEFGLSGESVRTRQLLRCDDAERDARVNREVCRKMGIASVLVMPVVNDDQVLGVFEIFSGKANAFGERDLSAVQRLSEMVETAVRMAHAADTLSEQLSSRETSVAEAMHPEVFEGQFLSDLVVEEDKERRHTQAIQAQSADAVAAAALESPIPERVLPPADTRLQSSPAPYAAALAPATPIPAPAKKPLFWSAAAGADGDSGARPQVADDSNVPPILRGLRKCEACGFPVSAGRVLCVECEEKKWRGQLKPTAGRKPEAKAVNGLGGIAPAAAAAAPAKIKAAPADTSVAEAAKSVVALENPAPVRVAEAVEMTVPSIGSAATGSESAIPDFVLSAGMEPSRSWFATYKWVLLALLLIASGAAAFLSLR